MLANGWELTTLGEVMEFKNGLNFTKADSGQLIKIVGVSDFKNHSELKDLKNLEVVNIAKIRDGELLTDGDLLFVRSNGNKNLIGRCLFFPKVNERVSFSGFTIRGRANQKRVIPDYIATLAISPLMKQQISRNGGGTNISNLSQQILNDIVFALPPIIEQMKIAQILATWDKAIANTEKLLENSQKQKQALMQQLLTGKKRFPRFSGEWKKAELGELLDYKQPAEFIVNSDEYSELSTQDSVPVLTAGKSFVLGYTKEQIGVYEKNLPAIIFDDFTTASKYVDFPFKVKSSAIKILTAKSGVSIKYIYEAMQLIKYQTGGHQRHWISIFSNIIIKLPKFEEQQKIASILSTTDTEINTLQDKLGCLKEEKKALMQQLLTGKKRVKLEG